MSAYLVPYGMVTVVCRQWRAAAAVFGTVMLVGITYLLIATAKYESVAELVVTFGDRSVPEVGQRQAVEMTPQDRREIVLSHAAILQSHDLAQATLEAIGLDKVYPNVVEDPPARGTPMDAGVRQFQQDLAVDVGAQDNILTIIFRHPDRQMAPKIVQKLIDLYVSQQTLIYHNPHSEFMSKEVKAAGERLDAAQTALEQFKGQWRINDYDKEVEDLLSQRGDLDSDLHSAKASLAQAQHRKADLEALMKTVPSDLPESASSEKYRALDEARSRLAELKTKQAQMLATYKPDSPAMASLNAGLAAAQHEVDARTAELTHRNTNQPNTVYQSLQTDYLRTSADAQSNAEPVRVLTDQLATIDKRLAELQQNRGQYNNLLREHQIAEETYHKLSTQYADARVKGSLNDSHISPAMVISEPTLPYKTARPRKLITLLVCLVAGTLLALGAALLLEARDDRFASAEQVAFLLDLPVLASFERRQRQIPRQFLALGGAK